VRKKIKLTHPHPPVGTFSQREKGLRRYCFLNLREKKDNFYSNFNEVTLKVVVLSSNSKKAAAYFINIELRSL